MKSLPIFGIFFAAASLLVLGRSDMACGFTVDSLNETNANLQLVSMRFGAQSQMLSGLSVEQLAEAAGSGIAAVESDVANSLNLYVAGSPFGFLRYDATTGEFLGSALSDSSTSSIALGGPNQNVFVASPSALQVLEYSREGNFIGVVAGLDSDINLFSLSGIAFRGSDNSLFIGDRGNPMFGELGRILQLSFNTQTSQYEFQEVFAERGSSFSPIDFLFHENGNLFVSDFGTRSVLEFNGVTGDFVRTFVSDTQIAAVGSIDFAPNGDLFLINSVSNQVNQILRYNSQGGFVEVFAPSGLFADLEFGPDGYLYVSDITNPSGSQILRFNIDTKQSEVFIPAGAGGLERSAGLAFGPAPIPEPTAGFALPSLFALLLASRRSQLRN